MTSTTEEIFRKYEVRKNKKQKLGFIEYVKSVSNELGYKMTTEKVTANSRNIIIGDPENANVIYTAHYDTCPVLPFPNLITPKSIPLYLLYQIAVSLILYIAPIVMFGLSGYLEARYPDLILSSIAYFAGCFLMIAIPAAVMFGPANKHTANDNTSGVTLLLDIMRDIPDESRDGVAFIFFDLEELGLIGSSVYAKKHKDIKNNKLLLNFDCVSDGRTILFAVNKKAEMHTENLKLAFRDSGEYTVDIASKGVIYPSDQKSFKLGVGVAALKKTKKGLLYMDKIHTKNDTAYDEANIEFLKNGAIELVSILKNEGITENQG